MGLFDTLKVMKDIVQGGVAAYKADEKLDELIARIKEEYKDRLSEDELALRKAYKKAKSALDESESRLSDEEKQKLQRKVMDRKLAYLSAVSENPDLPGDFREELANAVEAYKRAENMALNSLEETTVKMAESEEDRQKVRDILDDFKRK